jgi:hypothetical protein
MELTKEQMNSLQMGDVIEWTWDEDGVGLNGGQAIVTEDCVHLVWLTPYNINITTLAELRPDRCQLVGNIFSDCAFFKLAIDKKGIVK